MHCKWDMSTSIKHIFLTATLFLQLSNAANLKDIFLPSSTLTRLPRESKYPSRYGSGTSTEDKALKPENIPDTRDPPSESTVGKRCIRCETSDSGYYDRYPQDSRSRYYDRDYDDRDRYYDKDRYYDRDRYDRYPERDGYLPPRSRYGGGRDRYDDRYYDRYAGGGGGGGDRYDRYGDYDRYEPSERYDRYDRYPERGVGYDNRGYDYREAAVGYRPLDETYRGSSGFDGAGRGYYFAAGRPDYGASGSGGYGRGYANGYDYGDSGGGRDDYYRDRDRGRGLCQDPPCCGEGINKRVYGRNSRCKHLYEDRYNNRRDPYDAYRTTSYLHDRPSTTTTKPSEESARSKTSSSDNSNNSG